jgi:hypothetical protein
MVNFSKLNIKELLLYSPYDYFYGHGPILNEDDFVSQLRVIPDAYKDMKFNLMQSIRDNTYTIVSGYAGNGKTTFLHWFKEEIKDFYIVDIINVIRKGVGFDLEYTLVEKYLTSELWDRLDIDVFDIMCRNRDNIFFDYFDAKLLDKVDNYYSRCKGESENRELFESIFEDINSNPKNSSYSQKLILYILHAVLLQLKDKPGEESDDIKPYLLCFDNLDELRIGHLTDDVWIHTLDAISKLNSIFSKLENTKKNDLTNKISLLFVFRDANFAVGAAQANDRLSHITKQLRFFYTNSGLEITNKRLSVYAKYGHNSKIYDNDEDICNLMKFISEDKVLMKERLMPLFNYNSRQFSDAVVNIVTPESISGKLYSLFDMTEERYNAFPKDEAMRNGKRGIFMNTFIRHLSNVSFLERVAPKIENTPDNEGHCNSARMFLTVLCNLSFGNRTEESRDEKAEAEPVQVPLITIYKYCKDIMTTDDFFDTITSLIDFNKSSWAHLITVYNKKPTQLGKEYYFDFSSEKEILNAQGMTEDLKKIAISANASAYIYLRYILTHFEYIAAYKVARNNLIHDKPLFLRTNIGNYRKLKWEFEETIETVYKTVKRYYDRTENFFDEVFKKKLKYTREEYCHPDSVYIFKGDYHSKIRNQKYYPLYMTRLLTTHIRYLDDFRIYINNYYGTEIENTLNKIPDNLASNFKNKEGINTFLLEYIEKYVTLLKKIDDPAKGDIAQKLSDQLKEVKLNPKLSVAIEELSDPDEEEFELPSQMGDKENDYNLDEKLGTSNRFGNRGALFKQADDDE